MQFAPFHHPQVFQRPLVELYQFWRVSRATRARELASSAIANSGRTSPIRIIGNTLQRRDSMSETEVEEKSDAFLMTARGH
jgi:hypothetical protein